MDKITYITPHFAVTSQLSPEDFARAAALGFKAVISNRPDGEDCAVMTGRDEAVQAWRVGMRFAHVPAEKLDLFTDDVVEGMANAVLRLDGPILAHCKSGLRSAIVWAAASARSQPVDCVLGALTAAGFDLDFLRDDLESQAHRALWFGKAPAALDCNCEAGTVTPLKETAAA